MDRSKFPQGVEVQQGQLENVETQAAFHILQRFINMSRAGRISGEITVAASTTVSAAVDVTISGNARAYAPDGEMIQLSSGVAGLLVADATASTINYIVAVYRETDTNPQAHETDGTVKYTRVVRSADVKSYTVAQYDALPATDPDLSKDAKDRIVILAQVTAQGAAAFVTDVIQQSSYEPILTATLTTATPNVTGVQFDDVAGTVPTGTANAYLDFDTVQGMRFSSDFGATYGPWVAAALTSGTHTLLDAAGNAVVVDVEASLLPIINGTDIYTIDDIYTDIGPIFSGEDAAHRHHKGTGVQTRANPHGLGLTDLATFFYRLPTTLILGGDLLSTADGADQPRITASRSSAAGVARTHMWSFPGTAVGDAGLHIYADQFGQWELVYNAFWDNNTAVWTGEDAASASAIFRVSIAPLFLQKFPGGGTWTDIVGVGGWDRSFFSQNGTTGDFTFLNNVISSNGYFQSTGPTPGVYARGADLTGGASTADQITATNLITTAAGTGVQLNNDGNLAGTLAGTSDITQFRDGTFTGTVSAPLVEGSGAGGQISVPTNAATDSIVSAVGGITCGEQFHISPALTKSHYFAATTAIRCNNTAAPTSVTFQRPEMRGAVRVAGPESAGGQNQIPFGVITAGDETYNYIQQNNATEEFELMIPITLPWGTVITDVFLWGATTTSGTTQLVASVAKMRFDGRVETLLDLTASPLGYEPLGTLGTYTINDPSVGNIASHTFTLAGGGHTVNPGQYSYFVWICWENTAGGAFTSGCNYQFTSVQVNTQRPDIY